MKILVTGGAGFIASHIVDAYINAGHDVVVVDNLSRGSRANINPKAEFHQLDVNDGKIHDIIKTRKIDIINHHAAQINVRHSVDDPRKDAEINILGLLNLLQAARDSSVKKIILASSGGTVYGESDVVPTHEDVVGTAPLSPYGISKLTSEYYLRFFERTHNIPHVALRYANVYGPRQSVEGEAGVIAIIFSKMLAGEPFTINGGKQTRDYVFVKDVAAMNLLALEPHIRGAFNVGTSVETDVDTLATLCQDVSQKTTEIMHASYKPGEQLRSALDWKKASQVGWKPSRDLRTGLKETWDWYSTT